MAASLLDADCFLVKVLAKFGLVNWATDGYENRQPEDELSKQIVELVESMLHLLIIIIGKRNDWQLINA